MKKNNEINILKLIKLVAITIIIFKLIINIVYIPTDSMDPTITAGTIGIAWRAPYVFRSEHKTEKGEIVLFYSDEEKKILCKRVIGTEGDKIEFENGYLILNGEKQQEEYVKENGMTFSTEEFTVPEGCIFCLGDNRLISNDSRRWDNPYIPEENIRAKYMMNLFKLKI